MRSQRLRYEPFTVADLDVFHLLVQDDHIRRYLMDGNVMPREWSEARIRASDELFDRRGVGIWLVFDGASSDPVGFCGFLEIPAMHPEPQLVYALLERFTGRGYATEMARTAIAEARRQPGFAEIIAAVDEVNARSVHVLRKLGFERVETCQGAFGTLLVFRLASHA
jgi:RimJ/RimL family protein N-acetyltransferase